MTLLGVLDIFLHIDANLAHLNEQYGIWIYALIFLIIFVETGFVVIPFLPGDSLLFIAGALSHSGPLNIWILFLSVSLAAILGDTVNYWIGYYFGEKITKGRLSYFLRDEWLYYSRDFFQKFGGIAIIIARFVPYARTFAPFFAGISSMRYRLFLVYNIFGGILWSGAFLAAGYFFGGIPVIKENFTLLMYGILFLTLFALGLIIHRVIAIMLHSRIDHRNKRSEEEEKPEKII